MPEMSSPVPRVQRGAFETSLASLKDWRDGAAAALADLRRWALVHRLTDEQTATRLVYLERRLASGRLSVAFVAEPSRGTGELINALFFADLAAPFLPTVPGHEFLCPIEIHHDPARAPSLRLLPIESRDSPRALREFIADDGGWEEIALDPARPESLAATLGMLAQRSAMAAGQAQLLGLPAAAMAPDGIPRWRYAIVNCPHPVLDLGLAILGVPGLAALEAEPELTVHRIQDADAVVFMLSAPTGVTRADRDLWHQHLEPLIGHARFVVLNDGDGLETGEPGHEQALAEAERLAREVARSLEVGPEQVFPLSTRFAGLATAGGNMEAPARSRIRPFEATVASALATARRADLASAVRAEARMLLAEALALLESRRAFVREKVDELAQLQGKNQKLVHSLETKAADESLRNEDVRTALAGLRAVHHRHAAKLAELLDPNYAREAGNRARAAVLAADFSTDIGKAIDAYFRDIRGRIANAVTEIKEVKALMATVNLKFAAAWGLSPVEMNPFPTDRFLLEIDRLMDHCARDIRSASSLLSRGRRTLAPLFFDTVALKTTHVYEIAEREIRSWMDSFIRLLEAQAGAAHAQANVLAEAMTRMRDADSSLAERIGELNAFLRDCEERLRELDAQQRRLGSLLDSAAKP